MKYEVGDRVRIISREALHNLPSYKKIGTNRGAVDNWDDIVPMMYDLLSKESIITETLYEDHVGDPVRLQIGFCWHPLLIEEVL